MSARKPHTFSASDEIWGKVEQEAAESGSSYSAVVNRALGTHFQQLIARSSWSLEDDEGWYDEKKFYTYTEDKKGHSAKIALVVPKNIAGVVQKIVGSNRVPELRSTQDFYRSAIFHYAHKVGRWIDDEELIEQSTVAMMQAELDQVVQSRKDMDALIESARTAFDLALSDESMLPWAEAKLRGLWEQIGSVPEMFKKDLIEVLVKYGNQLKATNDGIVAPIKQDRDVEFGR